MRRREFIAGIGGSAAAWPLLGGLAPALAQTPGRIYRLGHLSLGGASEALTREITLPELARLGFIEGKNLVFDARAGDQNALPGLMGEVLAAKPDAVVAIGDVAIKTASAATRNVPIVGFGADMVKLGFAQSYARPGGNVTGVSILLGELDVKRMSILREALPDRRRLAALVSTTQKELIEPELKKSAAGLGVELLVFPVANPADYQKAFTAMRAAGVEALVIAGAPEFNQNIKQLAGLALESRLPTVCEWADNARDGCLLGYGPSRVALRQRVAAQVALIFRGEAPGNIAIELPAVFELAVNQKTAKSLGLTVPLFVLAKADEVFE